MKAYGTTDWLAKGVKELEKLSTEGTKYLFLVEYSDGYDDFVPTSSEKVKVTDFKSAVERVFEYYNGNNDMFFKGIRGFNNTDVDGIIEFHNHFSYNNIHKVFSFADVIWDEDQVEAEDEE